MQVLSQAFPPDQEITQKQVSVSHSLIDQALLQNYSPDDLRIEVLESEEQAEQLRDLQLEWFPIQYSSYFYRHCLSGEYHCLLAYYHNILIGAVVTKLKAVKEKYSRASFLTRLFSQQRCLHVLTLGVIEEFRQKGVASLLMQAVQQVGQVEYIYLQVIAYNEPAIRFYLRQGFTILRRIQDYYLISGKSYEGIIFVKYKEPSQSCSLLSRLRNWVVAKLRCYPPAPKHL